MDFQKTLKELGITQADLAKITRRHPNEINKICRGKRNATSAMIGLMRFLEFLHQNPYLLESYLVHLRNKKKRIKE